MSGKGALEKDLSRLLLRVIFSPIYIVDLFLGQWFIILVFAGDAKFAPEFPEEMTYRLGWRLLVSRRYTAPSLPDAWYRKRGASV